VAGRAEFLGERWLTCMSDATAGHIARRKRVQVFLPLLRKAVWSTSLSEAEAAGRDEDAADDREMNTAAAATANSIIANDFIAPTVIGPRLPLF